MATIFRCARVSGDGPSISVRKRGPRVTKSRGLRPETLTILGTLPRLLVTLGPLFRTLMEGPSPLTRAQRKMVAIVASKVNNCFY